MKRLAVVILTTILSLSAVPAQAYQVSGTQTRWYSNTVYVENHTGRFWDTKSALYQWNKGNTGVRMVYTRTCPTTQQGGYCIRVYARWDSYEAIGVSYARLMSGNDLYAGTVVMNRRYNYSLDYATRRGALIHELGHLLGLRHDTRVSSIMYYRLYVKVPSSYDYYLLRRIYG